MYIQGQNLAQIAALKSQIIYNISKAQLAENVFRAEVHVLNIFLT